MKASVIEMANIYDDDKIKRIVLTNRRDYKGWEVVLVERIENSPHVSNRTLGYFHEHETGFVIGEACSERQGPIAVETISSLSDTINTMLGDVD